MRRTFKIWPLLIVASLTACNANAYQESVLNCFDTYVNIKTKEVVINMHSRTCEIIKEIDAVSDAYRRRETKCVYDLNQTNEKLEVSFYLYDLLSKAISLQETAPNFNLMIGSLSNKWKESLEKEEVLAETVIQEELTKMNNSHLVLEKENDKYYAQRVGEGLIDVGAIAKGYALDRCETYLHKYAGPNYDYIINAGNSSVLLGKSGGSAPFTVKLKDLSKETYLKLQESFVSTSGISEQKTIIGGVIYSHIIDPKTGSATPKYDDVVVINDNKEGNGALGDVLSTSLMMSSLEEIKETEKKMGINVIVIKDDKILYKSESIELH